jgi:carbon-monoxide dehydrogenase large subunit
MAPGGGPFGAALKRREDLPLLTGAGRYLDDLGRPGMVYLGVVRSAHAHARVIRIDASGALALPGVLGVFGPADLPEFARPIPQHLAFRERFRSFEQCALAGDKARYVGEPVAVVVADEPYRMRDAVDSVRVEYELLPAVSSVAEALKGVARVHESWPDNVAGVTVDGVGNLEHGMAEADLVVHHEPRHPRNAGMPIEPRGVFAYEDDAGILVVYSSTQTTYFVRESIAAVLALDEERVRVIAPDVGGAFGAKAQVFPEEILVPVLARHLGRPVKWIETRQEHFVATCHDREQLHDIRVGFRRDGTIAAVEDLFASDFGAYPIQGEGIPLNTIHHLCAPYRVVHYRGRSDNVVTNKTFSAAYRGAGRPEAAFVMERMLDVGARRLGLDPAELRRRNLIRPEEMPYRPGMNYKDGVPICYDPADLPAAFEKALELLRYQEYRALQATRAKDVRRLGIGVACYFQGSGLGPYEGANVRVDPSGRVYVFVGVSAQGQGHATTLAQICAQELGVPVDQVTVVGADTRVFPYGIGAMASRVIANAGPALARAAREVFRKVTLVAATMLECAPDDIRLEAGRVYVAGVPGRSLALAQVATTAVRSKALAPTSEPGLNSCTYFYPDTVTWAFGTQGAVVEVDTETCEIRLLRYVAIHDCGRPVNPAIVEGQLHGGVAQGIGTALMEDLIYDGNGQLLTTSFMDYGLPTAAQLPPLETALVNNPSMVNELGVKGVGESGAIAPGAAIANAVEDALADFGITILELPMTPARLFDLLSRARPDGHAGERGRSPAGVGGKPENVDIGFTMRDKPC